MNRVLTGMYDDPSNAARATDGLLEAGFTRDEVCLLAGPVHGARFGAVRKTGTMAGLGGGALFGLLAGAAAGAAASVWQLAVPIAQMPAPASLGPAASALAFAGAGAAFGAVVGALIGRFRIRHEAAVRTPADPGCILVGVSTTNDMARSAIEVLRNAGALNVTRGTQ